MCSTTERGRLPASAGRQRAWSSIQTAASVSDDGRFVLNQTETLFDAFPSPLILSGGDSRVSKDERGFDTEALPPTQPERELLGPSELASFLQRRVAVYDKDREGHYNLISALHKSIRGSDPQASLYYLARMLVAG